MAFFHFLDNVLHGDQNPGGGVFGFLNNAVRYGPSSFAEAVPRVALGARDIAVGAARGTLKVPETASRSYIQGVNDLLDRIAPSTRGVNPSAAQTPLNFPGRNFAYGSEPIQTYQQQGQALHERFGINPVLGAVGLATLDIAPLGKPEKSILDQLIKAETAGAAEKILVKSGVDISVAKKVATAIGRADVKDPNVIRNMLDQAHGLPPSTPLPRPSVGNEISQIASPTPITGETAAGQGITELPKRPNALQRATLSVSGELSKQGKGGQEIANGLKVARDISETGQAKFIQRIPTVLNLKGDEFHQFHDALVAIDKGEAPALSPKIQQAVQEWQTAIPSVREEAVKAGLDVGDLGPNYFPRSYTELLSSDKGRNLAAQHLVDTGQADSLGEAAMILDNMKAKYNTPFGHFENSRTADLPGYDISKDAIINYVQGAYDKIGAATQFGPRNEHVKELLTQIGKEGHDVGRALDNFQTAMGLRQYGPVISDVSNKIRGFQRFRALGLSSLLNATQSTNTATVTGIWRTAKSAFKSFTPQERQYIKDTGVIIDSVLNNLREQAGVAGKITGKLTAPAFGAVEKFNRSVAAVAGKDYANKLAQKASKGDTKALKILQDELGIKGDIGPKLTPEQEIQAGRKIVELTQFKVDPQDLPNWTNSPQGKLVAQFRTFSYKQSGFVYNQVVKEALKGNPLPLARFIAVGIPMGVSAGVVRNTLSLRGAVTAVRGDQENPSHDRFAQAIEGLANIGAFGLGPTDAKFLGQNIASNRFPEYLAGTVGGPSAGLAVGTAIDVSKAAQGDLSAIERRGLKSLSLAGPALANTLVPYNPLSKNQTEYIDSLKKNGAPEEQIAASKDFFNYEKAATKKRQGYSDKIKTLLETAVQNNDQASLQKAIDLAKEYNDSYKKAFVPWAKQNSQYAQDENLLKAYNSNFITDSSFNRWINDIQDKLQGKVNL